MPIYDVDTRYKFYLRGMNPDDYDPIEEVEAPQPQEQQIVEEPLPSEPPKEQKKVGVIRSILSNALASFPSTAASIAAGAKAGAMLAATPAVGIPVIGPAIPLVGGIGTALATGILGRKLQDEAIENLAPESIAKAYGEEMQTTQSQHPTASGIGNVLGGLGVMKPNKSVLQSAGRALSNPLLGRGVSSIQKGNLLNVGLGGTIPLAQRAGKNVYDEGLSEGLGKTLEEIKADPGSFIAETVGGMFLNSPNALGRALKIPAMPVDPTPLGKGLDVRVRSSEPIQPIDPEIRPERLLPQYGDENIAVREVVTPQEPPFANLTEISEQLKTAPLTPEGAYARQVHEEALRAKAAAEAQLQAETQRLQAETERIKAETEQTNQLIRQGMAKGESPQPNDPMWTPEKTISQPLRPISEELIPKTDLPEYKPQGEPDPSDINWQEKAQERSVLQDQLERKNIPTQRTKAYEDFIKSELAPHRGIKVDEPGRIFTPKGQEVLGQADIKKRLIKINPNKAQLDTDAHELFHPFLRDLQSSPKSRDKALSARINRLIPQSEDFKSWKASRNNQNASVEEYVSTLSGEDFVRRVFNADDTGKIRNWFKDFWAYQKTKFGKASDADIARVMSGKMLNDPSYVETFGIPPVKGTPLPEESEEAKPSDTPEALGSRLTSGPRPPNVSQVKPSRGIPILKPLIDKVRDLGTPESNTIADATTRFFDTYTSKKGELGGVALHDIRELAGLNITKAISDGKIMEYLKAETPVTRSVLKKIYAESDGVQGVTYTAEEKPIADIAKNVVKQLRNEVAARQGLPQNPNPTPNYFPSLPKLANIRQIKKNRNSQKSRDLIDDFLNWHTARVTLTPAQQAKGITARQIANERLETLLEGYSKQNLDLAKHYAEIDKVEGLGLPPSWREDNLLLALQRFTDRAARRLAYHDTMENPDVVRALKVHSDEDVQALVNKIGGVHPTYDKAFNALAAVIKSANIGTISGGRDLIGNVFLGMQHQQNPYQTAKNFVGSLTNLKQHIAEGVKSGRIRENINQLEWGEDIGLLRRIADVLSDSQGRNFLEKLTRGSATGIGKLTTLDFLEQIHRGKLTYTGKKWFENFGEGINWKSGKLTTAEIDKIAARFVDSVQGTYDARGLPNFSMEGAFSPLVALARWNIEKSNNWNKHVLQPLIREKNPRPFLMSTIGMVAGGTLVKELTELASGRKDKTATYDELKAAKESGKSIALPLFYKSAGLATAAGTLGVLGDTANAIMDKLYGKTRPRWYNNMLFEFIDQTSDSLFALSEALPNEGDNPEMWINFVANYLADNHQLIRTVLNHVGDKEENIERANKYRDLRTFRLLSGKDVADFSTSEYGKKYKSTTMDKFKKTGDLNEATELLPELIDKAVNKAKDSGDITDFFTETQKLKQNSYQTMPNPETKLVEFMQYYDFLVKTQGKAEADKRLVDYFEKNAINRAKSAMVP